MVNKQITLRKRASLNVETQLEALAALCYVELSSFNGFPPYPYYALL